MGMFDRVWVKCPKCETENEFQTKSGECCMGNYTLEDCPDDVLVDVNRHSPCLCKCGAYYMVDTIGREAVLVHGKPDVSSSMTGEGMNCLEFFDMIKKEWCISEEQYKPFWNDVLTFARKYHKERKEYCR